MPYVHCPGCHTIVHSPPAYAHRDSCPSCESPLDAQRKPLDAVERALATRDLGSDGRSAAYRESANGQRAHRRETRE